MTRKPALAAQVGRCVVMGGAPCCEGNVTPAAEYNIWVDPEAARIVMLSGLPVELVGWQTCRGDAVLNEADIAKILGFDNPLARFAIECNSRAREAYKEQTGEDGISLPDPVAMSIALDPTIGTQWSEHYVDVETHSELTRGMTVVDRLNVAAMSGTRRSGLMRCGREERPKSAGRSTTGAGKKRCLRPCDEIVPCHPERRPRVRSRRRQGRPRTLLPG